PAFNDYMRWLVNNDLEAAALSLLYTLRVAHASKEERPDFYSHIVQPDKYTDARILRLGDGVRMLGFYTQFSCIEKSVSQKDYFKCCIESLGNDTLRGVIVVSRSVDFRSLEAAQEALSPYSQYLVTDSLRAQYNRNLSSLATFKKGEKAFVFNFKDNNGRQASLKDFHGKVVYIDTWATWCAPCREELPSLKKLEESYKDDPRIAFVSISIDEEKDTQKWLDFIKKEKLAGTQLHTPGWNNDFIKYYKINGIPRFLLIDQEGNLVSADAPRPSSGEELNSLLKKTIEKPKS
ncbi:MAG TPA: TlpA disulfide reductase family protein, partial [Chitinophaga sp.]